jgi:hypothetical protein
MALRRLVSRVVISFKVQQRLPLVPLFQLQAH